MIKNLLFLVLFSSISLAKAITCSERVLERRVKIYNNEIQKDKYLSKFDKYLYKKSFKNALNDFSTKSILNLPSDGHKSIFETCLETDKYINLLRDQAQKLSTLLQKNKA